MIDYSVLSDEEVNMAVASNLKQVTRILKPFIENKNTSVQLVKDGKWCWFDPCNNTSDAWSIITGNEIGILPPHDKSDNEWVAFKKVIKIFNNIIECEIAYKHKNPLRAAMIVFLMMQENTHD